MLYSGHLVIASGHFFVETAESWSNSHRKTPIHWTLLQWTPFFATKRNLPLYSRHLIFFCGKIEINCYSILKCFDLTHFSTYTFSELPISLNFS